MNAAERLVRDNAGTGGIDEGEAGVVAHPQAAVGILVEHGGLAPGQAKHAGVAVGGPAEQVPLLGGEPRHAGSRAVEPPHGIGG